MQSMKRRRRKITIKGSCKLSTEPSPPLIYYVNGGIGPECEQFHKHLAERIAEKSGEKYTSVITWIRCKLSFLLLRAALMCVRASRPHTTKNETTTTTDYALACRDAHIN